MYPVTLRATSRRVAAAMLLTLLLVFLVMATTLAAALADAPVRRVLALDLEQACAKQACAVQVSGACWTCSGCIVHNAIIPALSTLNCMHG